MAVTTLNVTLCIKVWTKKFKKTQWLKCRPDGTIAAKLKYRPDGISLKNLQCRQDGTVAAKL